MDGAFEEEGSVYHLQLLQGVVVRAIMLIVSESVNSGKTSIVYKTNKQKKNHVHIMVSKSKCFSSDNLFGLCCARFSELEFTGCSGWYTSIKL